MVWSGAGIVNAMTSLSTTHTPGRNSEALGRNRKGTLNGRTAASRGRPSGDEKGPRGANVREASQNKCSLGVNPLRTGSTSASRRQELVCPMLSESPEWRRIDQTNI